jgi:hypothetical protein
MRSTYLASRRKSYASFRLPSLNTLDPFSQNMAISIRALECVALRSVVWVCMGKVQGPGFGSVGKLGVVSADRR